MRQCWINPVPSYKSLIYADQPVSYWRSSGTDEAGTHPGVLGSGTLANQAGLLPGDPTSKSMHFDGTVNAFMTTSGPAYPTFQSFSLEAWMYPENLAQNIGPRVITDTGVGFLLLVNSAGQAQLNVGGTLPLSTLSDPGTVALGTRYHFVGTWDRAFGRVWLNNTLMAVQRTASGKLVQPASTLVIGNTPNFLRAWQGFLGDIAVYPYALNPGQITAHFQAGTVGPTVITSADVVYVDSAFAPTTSPAPAGHPIVPQGYVRQIGSDGFIDTGPLSIKGQVVPNIDQFVVPYYTGGWPPDPLIGQPGHTPQRPTGEG
jgi:hypothetical protein